MAWRHDEAHTDWRELYTDMAMKVEDLTRKVAVLEKPHSGSASLEQLRRDLRNSQDTSIRLTSDVDSLKQEVAQLKDKNTQLNKTISAMERDITAAQAEHFSLRGDLELLQTENSKLRSSLTTLQKDNLKMKQQTLSIQSDMEEVRCDVASVQNEVAAANDSLRTRREGRTADPSTTSTAQSSASAKGRPDLEPLQKELQAEVAGQRKDVVKLLQEVTSLRGQHGEVLADVSTLRSEAQTLTNTFKAQISDLQKYIMRSNTLVAFHAALSNPVTTTGTETLICDTIISNVGGGYDNRTGVFKAPVEGLYCFLVNASPCQRNDDKRSRLSVVLDNRKIAHVYSRGLWWSTGHTVVQLSAGQSVWLRTFDDDRYTFSEGWTNFTGILIQPQLRPSKSSP